MRPEVQSRLDRRQVAEEKLLLTCESVTSDTIKHVSEMAYNAERNLCEGKFLSFGKSPDAGVTYSDYEHRQGFRYRLPQAESLLRIANGRGGISLIIGGHTWCEYISALPKFDIARSAYDIDHLTHVHLFGAYSGIPVLRTFLLDSNHGLCVYIPDMPDMMLSEIGLESGKTNLNSVLASVEEKHVIRIMLYDKMQWHPTTYKSCDGKYEITRTSNGKWRAIYQNVYDHYFDVVEDAMRFCECDGFVASSHLV